MNNKMSSTVLPILFLITALPMAQAGYADDSTVYTTTPVNQLGDGEVSSAAMAKYLYNLGGELGFDLKNAVSTPISTLLLNPPTILESIAAATLITMMGAIPVDASPLDPSLANFVPSNNATYTAFNSLSNNTFLSYSSPTGTSSGATVSPLLDQQTYQSDPVSQFILNLMSTPNRTYCMDGTGTKWLNNNSQKIGDCDYLYDHKMLSNVVGSIPATPFLPPNTKNPIINDLNSNTLLAPLMYTTTSGNSASGSQTNPGLTGKNQAQQANNFIRYATGAVIPIETPTQANYNNLLMAINSPANDRLTKEAAIAVLDNYFAGMRVYAAKTSVPVSNLYYILSKRLPQASSNSGGTSNGTSQALSEMAMATRRMYDPAALATGKSQWVTQINNASAATVQKEMAILLSEINYQLYLNRQQEERLLLTNSLMLLESLKQSLPDVPMSDSLAKINQTAATGAADDDGDAQ